MLHSTSMIVMVDGRYLGTIPHSGSDEPCADAAVYTCNSVRRQLSQCYQMTPY